MNFGRLPVDCFGLTAAKEFPILANGAILTLMCFTHDTGSQLSFLSMPAIKTENTLGSSVAFD